MEHRKYKKLKSCKPTGKRYTSIKEMIKDLKVTKRIREKMEEFEEENPWLV